MYSFYNFIICVYLLINFISVISVMKGKLTHKHTLWSNQMIILLLQFGGFLLQKNIPC